MSLSIISFRAVCTDSGVEEHYKTFREAEARAISLQEKANACEALADCELEATKDAIFEALRENADIAHAYAVEADVEFRDR